MTAGMCTLDIDGIMTNSLLDWIAHDLLDSIVDSFFPYMEQIDNDVAALDKSIFSPRDQPPTNEAKGLAALEIDLDLWKNSDMTRTEQDGRKLEVTSEKLDFEGNDHRTQYSISCLTLNLLRCFRRPASQCKNPLSMNLSQNSKSTLRRIARVRRMVTLLSRLLAAKSEVITQIRKRLLADRRLGASAGSNLGALDIAMHMDDVQG